MGGNEGASSLGKAEPTTIGLSPGAHDKLKRLKEDGLFGEMRDAYKFAVALALAHGAISPPLASAVTIFNVGTVDSDRALYLAVSILRSDSDEPVYRTVERLAEWGVDELSRLASSGTLSFNDLRDEVTSRRGLTFPSA